MQKPDKKHSIKLFFVKTYNKIRKLARLNEDTDVDATVNSIEKSVEFKGVNLWILAFAIIVASVGLNINSTAVIIGAMLISPLMGPINGIGLAIGINDNDLLKKSLNNLILMVVISILASTSYFLISPLSDAQSELLARTNPSIFDVLIAFFGGLAGIVAISRKDQPFTVISGVAIATALMPPLCTAGYGIATWQLNYFLGAFYLFFINSFFIAIATFFMVRYLRFPQKKYIDENKKRLVKRYITVFSIIVIVPSIFMAFYMIRESSFNNQAIKYVTDIQNLDVFEDVQLVNSSREYTRKKQTISLSLIGKELTKEQISELQLKLADYGLENTSLKIKETGNFFEAEDQNIIIENLLEKKEQQIADKDSTIQQLESQLMKLNNNTETYKQVAKEILVQYPEIETFTVTDVIPLSADENQENPIPTVFVKCSKMDKKKKERLLDWLKIRLEIENLAIEIY